VSLKVSIAITNYNYGPYLAEAVDSALAQSYAPFEVLVVDDGSSDDSLLRLSAYGDRIRVIALQHQGICAVRNQVLQEARGDFLVFLDADDRLHPEHVKLCVQAWQEAAEPKPAFIYPQRELMGQAESISSFPSFDPATLKMKNYVVISHLLSLQAAREVGFDPAFHEGLEDFDFLLGMLEAGYRGHLVDKPLLSVRMHDQTRSIACGAAEVRSRILRRLLQKHHALYSSGERRAFRAQIRNYVLRRLQQSPPQNAAETWMALKLLFIHRAPPQAYLRLYFPASASGHPS